jgi:YfiH family protein
MVLAGLGQCSEKGYLLPMWRTSILLDRAGVRHGFGGVLQGDFRNVELPPGIAIARQVHGSDVARPVAEGRLALEADGLLAGPLLGLGVLTADCVPILLADPEARLFAAVHAGWRGTLKNVVRHAVEALLLDGANLQRLRAAIGPCIRPCCYQVSEDLLSRFMEAFGSGVAGPGSRLDLAFANLQHLTSVGIPRANVDDLNECTRCAKNGDMYVYFSHRRSGDSAGRQLSWVHGGRPVS